MEAVASVTPALSGDSLRRANAVMAAFKAPDNSDEAALRDEFEGLMAASSGVKGVAGVSNRQAGRMLEILAGQPRAERRWTRCGTMPSLDRATGDPAW
jgi:flagellar motor switch protein FliG